MRSKSVPFAVLAIMLAGLLGGCLAVHTPAIGVIYSDVKWDGPVTANAADAKRGTASASSVMGLVAWGDATVETAMKNGGITKIHHVDHKTFNILGFFGTYTTVVHGE